jgi:single-strand DNA-binding protein
MASFNRSVLVGNLCADVELRQVGDSCVTDLRLAVNDRVKRNGEWCEETTYIDVTFWGRTAEIAGEYLKKGSPCLVEGRLKQDNWQDRDTGANRSKHKIQGDRLVLLGSGSGGSNSSSNSATSPSTADIPF